MTAHIPTCEQPDCAAPSQTLAVTGRHCDGHPPRFSPEHAVHLAVTGRLVDALRYCRSPHETGEQDT